MKTYTFRFYSVKAEFGDGFVSAIIDGKSRYSETHEMTLQGALDYLPEFVNKVEDGQALVYVCCLSKPVPRGYNKATRRLEKRQ